MVAQTIVTLTRWLRMPSIFLIIGRIYRYPFNCNYQTNKDILLHFYCVIEIYIKFGTFWKKKEPHSLSIPEIVDSERRGYLNA